MYMRKKQQLICKYCGKRFTAVRSDAKRCSDCNKERIKEFAKSPRGKMLKSENHRKMRISVFSGYGGKCQCCGEDKFEFLAIDHVNGGGREERKRLSTGQIAKKIINNNFPPEYRVLCHNCNQSIGWYGYCPHNQWKRTA